MLFNSAVYIFAFLPTVFIVWALLSRFAPGQIVIAFLTAASLFFYAWSYPGFLPILIGIVLLNYAVARRLFRELDPTYRWFLAAFGIGANILVLFWFKYLNFAAYNVSTLLGLGVPDTIGPVFLPLGISFITFQKIAFLADVYQGKVKDINFWRYCLFVSFFPQLIAGPIVHHSEVMPQFADPANQRLNFNNIGAGLFLFAIGLFKKVAFADTFAVWANRTFDSSENFTTFAAWVGTLSYSLQIYFDFSGYTDMALGAALLFNIKLPINFNSPYKASNIAEFWTRWHITLGRLAPPISLHPTWRQSVRQSDDAAQFGGGHDPRRIVAWGIMDFRGLGDTPRRGACGAQAVGFCKDIATRRICGRIHLLIRHDCLGAVPRRYDVGRMAGVGRDERPE